MLKQLLIPNRIGSTLLNGKQIFSIISINNQHNNELHTQQNEKQKIKFKTTVNAEDVKHHGTIANDWWKLNGPLKPLHAMNMIRVPFIRDGLISTGIAKSKYNYTSNVLKGLQLLEVGCGGGILTEQLARLHANVTAIDPGEEVINIAKEHILQNNDTDQLSKRITYRCETIELHSSVNDNKNKYDAVIVSEVLEHVHEKPLFLGACIDTLKPGGSIFITTFDKTFLSWFFGIIVAENCLNVIPKNTHNWNNFIKPIDTQRILEGYECSTVLVNGFVYNPFRNGFVWTASTNISYALQAVKN